jgi:chromosome segregation ATPase
MSASPNYEIKKDPIDDDDDDIEILSNITNKKENRNNLMCSASVLAKSEFNTTTNRRIESKNDIKKIKQLEQMQEILFERIRIISNENEILKQNETNLMATNNELNRNIEIKTNDQMNLSNEITSLKENLFKAQETIELKTTEMNDLRIKIDEYELKINEMNLVSKSI